MSTQYTYKPPAARFALRIGNIRIELCNNPDLILLDRDGEGGQFLLSEFADTIHKFMSERL